MTVAAQVVTGLQTVVSREVDPRESAVLSVTHLASDADAYNVIPDKVELSGTVRTFSEETRERMPEAMERIVSGIAAGGGAGYSFDYRRGHRPVVNDESLAGLVAKAAGEVLGDDCVESVRPMAGDDFSAYQQVVPGVYFFIGARNEEEEITHPHHSARFDIDERALENGVRVFLRAALAALDAKPEESGDGA